MVRTTCQGRAEPPPQRRQGCEMCLLLEVPSHSYTAHDQQGTVDNSLVAAVTAAMSHTEGLRVVTFERVKAATDKDPELAKLREAILQHYGWRSHKAYTLPTRGWGARWPGPSTQSSGRASSTTWRSSGPGVGSVMSRHPHKQHFHPGN